MQYTIQLTLFTYLISMCILFDKSNERWKCFINSFFSLNCGLSECVLDNSSSRIVLDTVISWIFVDTKFCESVKKYSLLIYDFVKSYYIFQTSMKFVWCFIGSFVFVRYEIDIQFKGCLNVIEKCFEFRVVCNITQQIFLMFYLLT